MSLGAAPAKLDCFKPPRPAGPESPADPARLSHPHLDVVSRRDANVREVAAQRARSWLEEGLGARGRGMAGADGEASASVCRRPVLKQGHGPRCELQPELCCCHPPRWEAQVAARGSMHVPSSAPPFPGHFLVPGVWRREAEAMGSGRREGRGGKALAGMRMEREGKQGIFQRRFRRCYSVRNQDAPPPHPAEGGSWGIPRGREGQGPGVGTRSGAGWKGHPCLLPARSWEQR